MKNALKTHCKRGHEFTPENTAVTITRYGNGKESKGRWCRECGRMRQRAWVAKQGGAVSVYVGSEDATVEA